MKSIISFDANVMKDPEKARKIIDAVNEELTVIFERQGYVEAKEFVEVIGYIFACNDDDDSGTSYLIRFEGELSDYYIYSDDCFNVRSSWDNSEELPSKIVCVDYNKRMDTVDFDIEVWLHKDNEQKAIEVARKLILEYKANQNKLKD